MKLITALLLTIFAAPVAAATCDEWASMTQILVIRWQQDPQFEGKTNLDVKKELFKQMGQHPEIEDAFKYVDYAYENRKVHSQEIWQKTYNYCSALGV